MSLWSLKKIVGAVDLDNVHKELLYCGCKKVKTSQEHWFNQSKLHFVRFFILLTFECVVSFSLKQNEDILSFGSERLSLLLIYWKKI